MKPHIRLIHTSDWHLGRSLYGKSLIEDQAHFLEQLLQRIKATRPHALLIAGDVYDRALPPESAVSLFNRFLNSVVKDLGVHVCVIPGNHDSNERLGFGSDLLREQKLTLFSRPEDALRPLEISVTDEADSDARTGNCKVFVYGLPFVEPIVFSRFLNREDLRGFDATTKAMCDTILAQHDKKFPAVLMFHGFAMGSETSESERDLIIGGTASVDIEAFRGFAYTALGHLHKPQSAGHEFVRYSGSPLAYSKSEIGQQKLVYEITIDSDHNVQVSDFPIRPKRPLRYIEGKLQEILENGAQDSAPDDYVIVGLTDTSPVLDAVQKLRVVYPSLLHVTRVGGFAPQSLPARSRAMESLSDLDLVAKFLTEATGDEMNAEERSLVIDILSSLDRPGDSP